MAIAPICSAVFGNLGSLCTAQNGLTAATGIILTTDSFEFSSYTDFADQDKWEDAVKAKQIFPLNGIYEFDDNTEETSYYESPLGDEIKLRNGKYRFTFRFNLNLKIHQELQKFSSASLRYFRVDSDNNILGYSDDGTTVKGFTLKTFEAEKMMAATADTPAWSPIRVVESNSSQWNNFGIVVNPDWEAEGLAGLANVDLEVTGTPTATEIIVSVGSDVGLDSDGSVNSVAITGILTGDFVVLKASDGSTQSVVFTDNGDGTYTGVGTGLVTGTVNLASPSAMTSTGLLIESTGAASFTI